MPDVRDATTAYVFKDGRLAATLARTDRGTEFAYDRTYLDGALVPVATTLPLSDAPIVRPGRSVPAFFAGLLPEGRRLTALRRHLKISADDELSLTIAAGMDPVGDVSVAAMPELPAPLTSGTHEGSWSDVRFAELLADQGITDPSSLAGVQDKVSGRMISVPLIHDGAAHLLKLTPPEFPRLVENEAFFLGHARNLPVPVVAWDVIHDRDGVPGLLISRFDRLSGTNGLQRLQVEDASQLLNLHPGDKYTVPTEEVTTAVAAACASRPLAARSVFVQVAWAWLTGNGDLHAKNISIVGRAPTDGGTVRPEVVVSPVYDIPSTVPYHDNEMALPVAGTRTGITRRRLLEYAQSIGLGERAAARALDEAIGVAATMIEDVRAGGSPWRGKARDDLVRALSYRTRQVT